MKRSTLVLKTNLFVLTLLFFLLVISGATPDAANAYHEGVHGAYLCTDCHLTAPDPAIDTVDTVDFIADQTYDLCVICHADKDDNTPAQAPSMSGPMMSAGVSVRVQHKSIFTMSPEMKAQFNSYRATLVTDHKLLSDPQSPDYDARALDMSNLTLWTSVGCQHCHRMGWNYPEIPMTNLELCIACHGGKGNTDSTCHALPSHTSSQRGQGFFTIRICLV